MPGDSNSNKPLTLVEELKLEFGFLWRDPVKVTPVQKWKALGLLESVAAVLPETVQKEFVKSGLRKLNDELESKYRTKSFDYYEIIVDAISEHAQEYLKEPI